MLTTKTSDNKPKLPVGVSVLLTNEYGELLLGKRKNISAAGWWSTPGGRIEEDENMFAAAIREFVEETGAKIIFKDLRLIYVHELFRFGNHYIMFYIHARSYEGAIQNTQPDKCEGWEWFQLTDLPDPCTESSHVISALSKSFYNFGFGEEVGDVVCSTI